MTTLNKADHIAIRWGDIVLTVEQLPGVVLWRLELTRTDSLGVRVGDGLVADGAAGDVGAAVRAGCEVLGDGRS